MAETISMNDLRKIIREEIEESPAKKGLNHEEAATVASVASKLLSALESFEAKAPESAKSALNTRVPGLRDALEDMVSNPGTYVARARPENVRPAEEGPSPIEKSPKIRVIDRSKPVLDHHTFESINSKVRAHRGKLKQNR